jgi:hypothetical protein
VSKHTLAPGATWTPRKIALANVIDVIEADIANDAEYLFQHPVTHAPLAAKSAEAVQRHMEHILAGLKKNLMGGT